MMKQKLKLFCIMFVLGSMFNCMYAQSAQVTGKVTQKSNNQALAGVSVGLKKGTAAAVTDNDGNYSITIPQEGATLVVSYVGMITMQKKVTSGGVQNFSLDESTAKKDLEDITNKKSKLLKITELSSAYLIVENLNYDYFKKFILSIL